jgi:putative tricarboxylic transport membrane protein
MKDRILAVAAAIGALLYLYSDWHIPRVELGDPLGPRAFPALVGILLLVSAVLLMLETRHREAAVAFARSGASHWPILLCVLLWTICYYTAFEPAGYIIATIVYIFGLLCVFNKRQHKTNALISVGFTAVAYTVFSQLLNVQLPLGPLNL